MPKITVNHISSVPPQEAMAKIKSFFETDKDMHRIDPKIQCHFGDDLKGKITGSQFKAEVNTKAEGKGSNISLTIDLPLLLTPIKGKVEETLKKKLAQHLA